ncbi:uncharacterized protein [Magallana gigas]|uniref:uncharacterized protein n=1 Tax=Magallana gigas TaxID=29159 RepID=UPI00333F88CB
MDKTDITEETMEKPQEIMRWFPPTTQKILDVRVRLQEDFGNPRQPATDYSQYQVAGAEHMSLEKLEMKYQLAKLFMYRRLVQERFMAMEREEGKSTCIITEVNTHAQKD